jgi:hypothetical protein
MFFRYFRNSNILEMKKIIALGAFVGALFMTSCEPNGPAEEPATYPGDSLTVSNAARPLVIETTGAWCQYCPNGAEIMTILDGVLEIALY